MNEFKISDRLIGDNHPVFIVAELSCNHLQNLDIAKKTIKAAKEAGANAIKVQTVSPETLTINCDNEYFQIKGTSLWDGQTLNELYAKVSMPWEWHNELKEKAKDLELIFFSSPVDKTGVDFLEDLDVPAYKIASFEICDLPFIEYVASKGKPIILSTGVANLNDIENAINTIRKAGNDQIAILKCVSIYPTPLEELNLKVIPDLEKRFKCVVGLSDHSLELSVPLAAVALGAKIVEKHLILNRELGGADSAFSLEPNEFKDMIIEIRKTEKALGEVSYNLSDAVLKSRSFARSLFAIEDIKKGEKISEYNIKSIRPGAGLHPKHYNDIIGKRAKLDIKRGTPLKWELIE